MKWISVKDQLPELESRVLVADADSCMEVAKYTTQDNTDDEGNPSAYFYTRQGCCCHYIEEITHWMAIEPPKQDKDEKA
jgi:hypothetical protein